MAESCASTHFHALCLTDRLSSQLELGSDSVAGRRVGPIGIEPPGPADHEGSARRLKRRRRLLREAIQSVHVSSSVHARCILAGSWRTWRHGARFTRLGHGGISGRRGEGEAALKEAVPFVVRQPLPFQVERDRAIPLFVRIVIQRMFRA